MKVTITNDVNESYNEIVEGLKNKYSQIIFSRIDELKMRCYEELSAALNNDLKIIFKETCDLKDYYEREKKAFKQSTCKSDGQNIDIKCYDK